MSGMKGTAPCGHPGTYVTVNFITCDYRCEFTDAEDTPVLTFDDRGKTQPLCAHCGSDDLEEYPNMTLDGRQLYHCHNCEQASLV